MDDKKILFIVISAALLLLLIIGNFRYNRVVKQLNKMKIENAVQVDSLIYANHQLEQQVNTYKIEVSDLEHEIDSLQQVKNRIIVKKNETIVSKSVSEGIVLLQNNLSKWSEY